MRTRFQCPRPQGRLSLTNTNPNNPADVTAAGTIYYVPHVGEIIPMRRSRQTLPYRFAQASMLLDSDSGHTQYHQADKNFDVFAFITTAGIVDIGTGPAWTSDTSRGTGAGTTQLAKLDGLYSNAVDIQLRTGNAVGALTTVTVGMALYLGTIRTTADGQTEDSMAKRFVWNAFNRIAKPMRVFDPTNTWAGSAAASFRQANNSTANQLDFVRGLDDDLVTADGVLTGIGSGATAREVRCGIGLGAANALAAGCLPGIAYASSAGAFVMSTSYRGLPGIGRRFLTLMEYDNATDTRTYYGDNNAPLTTQSGIHGVNLS